jgi:hypothetical protein
MAQLFGQVVTDDDERIGIVSSVSSVTRNRPDLLKKNAETDEVVERIKQDPISLPAVAVKWEDGSSSTLVETEDDWKVLGSVVKFDAELDPEGKSKAAKDAIGAALSDVGAYAEELRAAGVLVVSKPVQYVYEEDA